MKRQYFLPIIIIVLGVFLMTVPYLIFPVCETQIPTAMGSSVPMKCFWTARITLACGGIIALGGILLGIFASVEARKGILFMILAVSLFVIAVPNFIIGVCPVQSMHNCRLATLPAITILGAISAVVSIISIFISFKTKKV